MTKIFTCMLFLVSLQCVALEPTPELTPIDVVSFQLKSLQSHTHNEGIAATFRFA